MSSINFYKLSNKNKGFSLLEVLISMMIFAVSIVSVIDSMNLQNRFMSKLEDGLLSSWAANNYIVFQYNKGNIPSGDMQPKKVKTGFPNKSLFIKVTQKLLSDKFSSKTVTVSTDKEHEDIVFSSTFYGLNSK